MSRLHTFRGILMSASLLLALVAAYFIVTPETRIGNYNDSFQCGDGDGFEYHPTLVDYHILTGPVPDKGDMKVRSIENVGTCPYNNYLAKTWALDIWVLAVLGYAGTKLIDRRMNQDDKA